MIGQQRDQACHQLAMKRALDDAAAAEAARQAAAAASAPPAPPAYKPVGWSNTKTGNSGTITPVAQTAGVTAGAVCMDYVDQQIVNGQAQRVTAKACRAPDGEWKPVT
jgi:surface antigen